MLKLEELFRNQEILLDPDPWIRLFLRNRFQEAKILRIPRFESNFFFAVFVNIFAPWIRFRGSAYFCESGSNLADHPYPDPMHCLRVYHLNCLVYHKPWSLSPEPSIFFI